MRIARKLPTWSAVILLVAILIAAGSARAADSPPSTKAAAYAPVRVEIALPPCSGTALDRNLVKLQRLDIESAHTSLEGFREHAEGEFASRATGERLFNVSLTRDKAGNVWSGCEDAGVWCFKPRAATGEEPWKLEPAWNQFTIKDGLGDNSVYALACDQMGRVWAGHLNHGVSVFNGQQWKNYGVTAGPLGGRVFDIGVCPTDGDVWIASESGLTRYSAANDTWSYLTRADGLPSNQIQALDFDAAGNIYCATQSDGMAMADVKDGYRAWRHVNGPDRAPMAPQGDGLPARLINDVLVSKSGTVYAATTNGLAWSNDRGKTWRFVRGKDWADKVRGSYGGPPNNWKEGPGAILAEDYVTCLAEDKGALWVGHRHWGYESVNVEDGRTSTIAISPEQNIRALLASGVSLPWASIYSDHIKVPSGSVPSKPAGATAVKSVDPPPPPFPLPSAAKPPTRSELDALRKLVSGVASLRDEKFPVVTALDDDWSTQGAWLGRYGRYWAALAAMTSPSDYIWGGGPERVDYSVEVDPRDSSKGEAVRYAMHMLQTSSPRILELPPTYMHSRVVKGYTTADKDRRHSQWDDHGAVYPVTREGPDLFVTVSVPAGLYYLSLYDVNRDRFYEPNQLRDYPVSIRIHPDDLPLNDVSKFDQQPEIASGRISNFWHGVYKRFLVHGPAKLTARVSRNYSYSAILAAAMLDLVDEAPPPYFKTVSDWNADQARVERDRQALLANPAADQSPSKSRGTSDAEYIAVLDLTDAIENARLRNPVWGATDARPFYLQVLRSLTSISKRHQGLALNPDARPMIASCYYQLGMYTEWEKLQRELRLTPARDIEKSLRWDERSYSNQAKGYQLVTEQVAKAKTSKPGKPTANPAESAGPR